MNHRAAGIALVTIAAFLWVSGQFMQLVNANFYNTTIANGLAIIALIIGIIYLYIGEKNDPSH